MNNNNPGDLMNALVAKLYATITGNDGSIKTPRNKFVSWFLPGIPFGPEDFTFCSKGFIGNTAEETLNLYHQGFVLSKLFDFVPDVGNQFIDNSMQQTIFTSSQDSISSIYKDVLKYSRVVDLPLSETELKKLQDFRNKLTTTKEVIDIMTDEKKTVTEPGPLTKAYTSKMSEYMDAADEYMNLIIDAQSAKGDDPEAIRRVAAFSNKSKFLRKKMEAAEMAWISEGYKNEYEQINAYINQVTQKSMVLYKQDLQNKFNSALLTSAADGGSDFYYTTLLPGNFASNEGWSEFSFYEGDFETHFNKDTNSWGAKAGYLGIFSAGASGSKTKENTSQKSSNFKASFKFTQVPICRPFFEPGFFAMRGWTLDKLWDLNFDKKPVSDGEEKPSGRLVAYPITALFVKDVTFTFDEAQEFSNYSKTELTAGGSVSWGLFSGGGKYSKGKETKDVSSHTEGSELKIEGIQLIGFINSIIPQSPNPDPSIKPEQFVGGEQE